MSIRDTIGSIFGGKDDEEEILETVASEVAETATSGKGDLLETVESSLGGLEGLIAKIPG
jgi:hypothetical protein